MWWIIHWVFCNWDFLNLADGALVLSPLGLCNLRQTYAHIIVCHMLLLDIIFLRQMHAWFLAKAWPVWGCLSPTCSSANHVHPHQSATQETHFVQLIGWEPAETDSNWHWVGLFGSAALRLCKCQSADLAESLKREGFLVLSIVLLLRPSGKQVGAQLRYCQEKDNAIAEGECGDSHHWADIGEKSVDKNSCQIWGRELKPWKGRQKVWFFLFICPVSCLKKLQMLWVEKAGWDEC